MLGSDGPKFYDMVNVPLSLSMLHYLEIDHPNAQREVARLNPVITMNLDSGHLLEALGRPVSTGAGAVPSRQDWMKMEHMVVNDSNCRTTGHLNCR